jgi:hypothetical protein
MDVFKIDSEELGPALCGFMRLTQTAVYSFSRLLDWQLVLAAVDIEIEKRPVWNSVT